VARVAARLDRDRKLAFMPQDDPEAEPLLAVLPEDERFETWHLAAPDGSLAGHGAGVVELLGALRLTRPLGRLLGLVPNRALDRAYGVVARQRGRLGRLVPDRPGPRRFP
jgi:predicted DCC family thiol-disulfide oxidoreductase YuxK